MKLSLYQKPNEVWFEKLPVTKEYPRHWVTIVDIEIELSNGFILKEPKGCIWDGASIPKWLWFLAKPIDDGAIGDFIHDWLWVNKKSQLEWFNYNIYNARSFSDNERYNWRMVLASNLRVKTKITHFVIRKIGGFYYSRQFKIVT